MKTSIVNIAIFTLILLGFPLTAPAKQSIAIYCPKQIVCNKADPRNCVLPAGWFFDNASQIFTQGTYIFSYAEAWNAPVPSASGICHYVNSAPGSKSFIIIKRSNRDNLVVDRTVNNNWPSSKPSKSNSIQRCPAASSLTQSADPQKCPLKH